MAQAVGDHVPGPIATEGRVRFGGTIVIGHALKHVYLSSLAAVLMPEIKLGLGLSGDTGRDAGVRAAVHGLVLDDGLRLPGRPLHEQDGDAARHLAWPDRRVLFPPRHRGQLHSCSLAMLVVGIGPSLFHPPALGALSRRFPDRRSFAISMHGTGGSFGEASARCSPPVCCVPDLSRCPADQRHTGAARRLHDVDAAEASRPRPRTGHSSFRQYLGSFGKLMAQRALLLICLVTALRSVGQAMTTIFLPVYLREDLGYSAGLVASTSRWRRS